MVSQWLLVVVNLIKNRLIERKKQYAINKSLDFGCRSGGA